MTWLARAFAVTIALLGVTPAYPIDDWFFVPPDKSGIVILFDDAFKGGDVTITDITGKELSAIKNMAGPVALQVRLQPGHYQVFLSGYKESVLESVNVNAPSGKLNYLEIEPFLPEVGPGGRKITVWPQPMDSDSFMALFDKFKEVGFAELPPQEISPKDNIIFVNSSPIWPMRPEPTKPPEPPAPNP